MPFATVLLLGFIAGATIVLGMPLGRMKRPAPNLRILLNAIAIGVLVFILWDVLAHAWEPINTSLSDLHAGKGDLGSTIGLGLLFGAGIAAGLLGLTWYERWMGRKAAPGSHLPPRQLALLVAIGIGVHNLAEGLAIGQSAASGALGLAAVLVVGFALHNATEGFGIVAPLAADTTRPSLLGFLLLLGAIGGAPTFIGTAIGWASRAVLSVLFLSLAAGSILYVVIQLLGIVARAHRNDLVAYGVLAGLFAGFATDAIVTLGGA